MPACLCEPVFVVAEERAKAETIWWVFVRNRNGQERRTREAVTLQKLAGVTLVATLASQGYEAERVRGRG